VDAPHELPLADGQAVAMRCWWRHWGLADAAPAAPGEAGRGAVAAQTRAAAAGTAAAVGGSSKRGGLAGGAQGATAHARKVAAHHEQVHQMMASGWAGRVAADWAASLAALEAAWRERGPFDGVLGFSNGAAAGFLLAAHAAARPGALPGLGFAVLAGGYVPQPLGALLPPALVAQCAGAAGGPSGAAEVAAAEGPPGGVMAAILPFDSLHIMGDNDPVIDVEDSLELAGCFEEGGRCVRGRWAVMREGGAKGGSLHERELAGGEDADTNGKRGALGGGTGLTRHTSNLLFHSPPPFLTPTLTHTPNLRQVLRHESGHCVPQQARHCAAIVDFVAGHLPEQARRLWEREQQQRQRQQHQRESQRGVQQQKQKEGEAGQQQDGGQQDGGQQDGRRQSATCGKEPAPAAATAAELAAAGAGGSVRKVGPAAAAAAAEAAAEFDATEEQREEMEALEVGRWRRPTPSKATSDEWTGAEGVAEGGAVAAHLSAPPPIPPRALSLAPGTPSHWPRPRPLAAPFLQAIFMSEYTPISARPPRFAVSLRQPGEGGGSGGGGGGSGGSGEEGASGGEGGAEGPPHRLFSLKFTLTPVGL
jgi:hypothetical protein